MFGRKINPVGIHFPATRTPIRQKKGKDTGLTAANARFQHLQSGQLNLPGTLSIDSLAGNLLIRFPAILTEGSGGPAPFLALALV